jgi:hypothetical protein
MLALGAPAAHAAEPALSPEGLGRLIECRGSTEELGAYGEVLLSDKTSWLKRLDENGHAGMLGLWSFRLGHPVTIFGRSVETVSFLNQWVVIELPRAEALAVIRSRACCARRSDHRAILPLRRPGQEPDAGGLRPDG